MPRSVLKVFPSLVLVLPSSLASPEPLIVRSYPSDHFAISVPSGWVEIARSDLEELAASLQVAAPKAGRQSLNYGFQFSPEAPYPKILVQVNRTGRISEDTIHRLSKAEELKEQVRNLSSSNPAIADTKPKVRKVSWDPNAAIVWTEAEINRPDGVSMTVLAGMHPTEFGAISVYGYSTESDFERFGPTFKAVINSVNIDAPLRYRERSLFARAMASIAIPALFGSGCAIGTLWVFRRRRNAKRIALAGQRASSSGAAWKIPLGLLLVIGHVSTLAHALGGDGWLETTAEAQGYWFSWGLFSCVGLFLIYSGSRGLRAK